MPLLPLIEEGEQISIESPYYFRPYPCQQQTNRISDITGEQYVIQKEGTEVKCLEKKLDLYMG